MTPITWRQAGSNKPPVPPGTAADRLKLRKLIRTAITRAQNEGELQAADELLAILDTMEPGGKTRFDIDLRGARFPA
jgi:hypothetical protein